MNAIGDTSQEMLFIFPGSQLDNWHLLACNIPDSDIRMFKSQTYILVIKMWVDNTRAHFYSQGLILIPECISNHTPSKVWDGINYPLLNFNGCTVEV